MALAVESPHEALPHEAAAYPLKGGDLGTGGLGDLAITLGVGVVGVGMHLGCERSAPFS